MSDAELTVDTIAELQNEIANQREVICNLNAMNDELQAKIDKVDKAIEELRKEIEENHLNVIDYADGEWIVKDFVYGAIERLKRKIGE